MSELATGSGPQRSVFGIAGFALGAMTLIAVLVVITGGPFAPQTSGNVALGETMGEIGKAMVRNWAGIEQPAPEARPWNIDRMLWVGTIVSGALSFLLGAVALLRREKFKVATFAMGLGVASITLQLAAGFVVLILGLIVVLAIISMFGDFLGGIGIG